MDINFNELRLDGVGGLKIFARSWWPKAKPKAVVVIVHGFNSHSGHYSWVADQLVGAGLAVYALDLRGRGLSDGERFFVDSFSEYQSDVDLLIEQARSLNPGLPIFMLGHSAGGVNACIYTLDHPGAIAGLICESFAYKVPAPNFALSALKGLSHLAPHAHVLRLPNEKFSRDPAVVKALNNDPLIKNEVQPTKTVAEMVRANERLKRDFPKFKLPLLIIHGTKDVVTKPEGSKELYERASSSDKTLKLYDGHFHDLLNDIGREIVMGDIKKWIGERLPA